MHQVFKQSNAYRRLYADLATLLSFTAMPETGVFNTSLDRRRPAGAVESANGHPTSSRVETATQAAFGSRVALRGMAA